MQRKLASIQKVLEVNEIYDKDGNPALNIEEIKVLGWRLVAKKAEFKVGDLCVYLEIDSTLNPELFWVKEYANFLESKKWRVKTMKLNNMNVRHDNDFYPVVSQGLALPLDILGTGGGYKEGQEVTDILGVYKYEAPIKFIDGNIAGNFPEFIPKTDEPRIQSVPNVINGLTGKPYYISLKYDGTSLTAWRENDELNVASRNFARKNDGNVYWQMALKYKLDEVLAKFPNYAIQGEVCGTSIQRNLLNINGLDLFVFNIFNIETGQYLSLQDMAQFCLDNNLQTAEILEIGTEFNYTIEQLEAYCKGYYDNTTNHREGIVVRTPSQIYSKYLLGRLSFKVINVDYLLKEK